MKAFKPDGSRWFARSALEVMTEWLEQSDLQGWLECTVVFRVGDAVGVIEALNESEQEIERECAALLASERFRAAVFGRASDRVICVPRAASAKAWSRDRRGKRERVKR